MFYYLSFNLEDKGSPKAKTNETWKRVGKAKEGLVDFAIILAITSLHVWRRIVVLSQIVQKIKKTSIDIGFNPIICLKR